MRAAAKLSLIFIGSALIILPLFFSNMPMAFANFYPVTPPITPPVTPPVAVNKLNNPSFEWDENNDRIPDFWTYNRTSTLSVNEGRNCSVSMDGACSFQFNQTSKLAKKIWQEVNVIGTANSDFNFSIKVKASAIRPNGIGSAYAKVFFYNAADKQVYASKRIEFTKGTYDFREFKIAGSIPVNYSKVKVEVLFNTTGTLWVDSATLQ